MSADGNTTLPDRLARKLAGTCLYGRCTEPAKDDADFCAPHHEVVKGWKREWAKKQRKAIRKARQCRDCGKASKRVRCPGCRKAQSDAKREARRVERESRRVEHAPTVPVLEPRGHVKVEHRENCDVERYVGRDRRGAPSRDDRDDDLVRDALTARAEIDKFIRAFDLARSEAVRAMPRVQREHARALARDHVAYAARFLDSIVDALE